VCGNGVLELGEVCDDGNDEPGDGCEPDCTSSDDVEPEWTLQIDGSLAHDNCGTGVTFDADGNLIVSGYIDDEIWIRKYDPDYGELWTVTYPQTLGTACVRVHVATDDLGNVGFGGDTNVGPGDNDMFFGVLDPDGGEIWTRQFGFAEMYTDEIGDVAFDPEGNLLVVGTVVQENMFWGDIWIGKYDADGLELWSDTYDGPIEYVDAGYGVTADADGNVLVTGVTWQVFEDGDIFVRKYDPDGGELWTDIYAGPVERDWGYDVGVDGGGAARVGGVVTEVSSQDAWMRTYASDGEVLWTQTYDGPAGQHDNVFGVAVADDGFAWAAGRTDVDVLPGVAWLRKYDPDGETVWTRQGGPPPHGWLAVARAADGRVAVAGYAFEQIYDAAWAVYPP